MNVEQIPQLLSFNYAPAEYIDVSWLQDVQNSDMMLSLMKYEEGKRWVSQAILKEFDLEKSPYIDFDHPVKEIIFQPKNVLVQIIFHAGLVLNHPLFRNIVRRNERKLVETTVGDKAYHYALKKAPLMSGKLVELFPCEFTIDWDAPAELKKHLFRSGMKLLGAIFEKEPKAFQQRILWHFPLPSQEYFYAGAQHKSSPDDVYRLGTAVFKKLVKEFGT